MHSDTVADATEMVVANTFFKERDNRLVTYQSGNSNNQLHYVFVRKFGGFSKI